MVDVNVNFVLGNDEPLRADFELQPDVTYTADIKLSEATRDHTKLYNRDRANQHPMSAITGLESALGDLDTAIGNEVTAREEADGTLSGAIDSNHNAITEHVSDKSNPHEVTKAQVGLGNVDNTSDSDKPLSTATQTALDGKVDKTTTADRVYGTDSSGNQTTYDKGSFGQVDDVKVAGVSVVTSKVANLGSMASETASDYYTSAQVDTALSAKQDNLSAGNGIDITSNEVSVTDPTLVNNGTGTKALAVGKTSQSTAEGGVAVGYGAHANSTYGTAVGYESRASNTNTTVIGKGAKATQARAIAIGSGAEANADDSIAIKGVNNTANTFQVYTYNMLDMSTGLIPDARISANIARTSDLPTNYVTTDTAQTITAPKTFHNCAIESDNFITLTSPNAYIRYSGSGVVRSLLRRNSSGTIEVASSNDPVKIQGSATRPAYNSSDLALYSDVTSGDSALQSQIDALVVASDVFDIVGTYAELQAYDISTVPVNDIIKVLVDSTHAGAATYYRCVENNNVKSWSYIGSEGAYYTKAEADSNFVPQTRTVNNKALSSDITLTATDVGALPSSTSIPTATSDLVNDSGFITSADLPTNYVTTDTAQDIDSVKTFLGEKAIHFKQKAATNKLGFTLYNVSNAELGAFEYRPNTISGGALLNVNVPYTSSDWVGFRYWGTAVNVIAPKVATAGNYYIPVNFTDGNTTVTANNAGTVNLSSLIPSAPTYTAGTGIDITNDVISVTAPTLVNTANSADYNLAIMGTVNPDGTNQIVIGYGADTGDVTIGYGAIGSVTSVTIGNGATSDQECVTIGYEANSANEYCTAIGYQAVAGASGVGNCVAIGDRASATGDASVAILGDATANYAVGIRGISTATSAIQIGRGINSTANSFSVGFGWGSGDNYPLLDGTTGLIPDARISSNIARTSAIPSAYGAGLSYSSSSLQLLDQNGNNLGSAVTIKSTPDLDGVTIDTNSDDELEAIGTVNKNTAIGATAVKYDWIGTLAEYNAQNVETLHPEWICYITDDVSGGTSVYTKAEVDSAISTALTTMLDSAFPVGSRYITEASTCPLATLIPNSTWVLTSQGRVLQGADSNHASGTTAEAGLPNIQGNTRFFAGTFALEPKDTTGAFYASAPNEYRPYLTGVSQYEGNNLLTFDASRSNPIYGNSTTVQPPAEFVNIFKRTA